VRKKILLGYFILIITGMTITGFFVSGFAQNLYLDEVKYRLVTIASLFDHEIEQAGKDGGVPDYNALSSACAGLQDISSRITVIDYHGKVLGDSESDYHEMENHLDRKEVQQAIEGKTGEAIRFSDTLKTDFLYMAVPSAHEKVIIRISVPLGQLRKIHYQIWGYCILGILTGFLLTTLIALRFTSALIRPVKVLTRAAKEISDGNYSRRVRIKSGDELGELASTFNEMAGELDSTVADLKDKNVKFDSIMNSLTNCFVAVDSDLNILLINSIACRLFGVKEEQAQGRKLVEVIRNHPINEILQQAVLENRSIVTEISMRMLEEGIYRVYASPIRSAEGQKGNSGAIITIHDITAVKKLEQIRTDFVSNVTHELKTPLTSIRGFVETLRSGAVNDAETTARFLDIIDIEAERLTMLINDILQLSEIETRQSDINISSNNLGDIIDEVASILQSSADKKGVRLLVEADRKVDIVANRDRIKQMLINLVDNAINYNVETGEVRIRAHKTDGRLIITVSDTGIGIAQQHLSRIFERFYRVDKGRSRNMGGTGLGLSIVKHIVNLYDGDIRVESEPGKGTEFIIQLPV
jgi:two-component system phosphate regulon sensor histidine kinase PhoR